MPEFKGVEGEILRRKLIRDYPSFVQFANEGFCMTKFHHYVTHKIQEFLNAKTENAFDILLLSVPPRHGKSFMVTETLPTWYLGNNPRGEVIICSYQSTFAEGFSRICRDKFNRLAPDIWHVSPDKNLQRAELWATEQGGRCRAAGLDAGISSSIAIGSSMDRLASASGKALTLPSFSTGNPASWIYLKMTDLANAASPRSSRREECTSK